jgi:hypothetical protein
MGLMAEIRMRKQVMRGRGRRRRTGGGCGDFFTWYMITRQDWDTA